MRKIDKSKILSSKYKEWERKCEREGVYPSPYDSSRNDFYLDVVLNLLHAQDGLCAYTEIRLCSQEMIDEDQWKNGRYSKRKPEFFGQLDHFDPSLKSSNPWKWENLFMVHSDINIKIKNKHTVDSILKPDEKDYDPEDLLEYDAEKHIFIPNSKLEGPTKERVKEMILTLGINYDPVVDRRKSYINERLKCRQFGLDFSVEQFYSAFKMCNS